MTSRKPNVTEAMRDLIKQARAQIPFDMPDAYLCGGQCIGCSKKLLSFLEDLLIDWEERLDAGEKPTMADLCKLAKTCKKIRAALERGGLM